MAIGKTLLNGSIKVGVLSSDPSNPVKGEIFFNSTEGVFKFYNGTSFEVIEGKAKVSSNDTTSDYLKNKLVAGTDITITENNDGSNETLTIASTASGGGGSSSTPDSISVGGRVLDDATNFGNLKILHFYLDATATNYSTARDQAGNAYTPSGSNKFVAVGMMMINNSGSRIQPRFGYGDNDVGLNNGSAPTNAVYAYTGSASIHMGLKESIGNKREQTTIFEIPNGKFPFIFDNTTSGFSAFLIGYETT